MSVLYLDDLTPGLRMGGPSHRIDAGEIKRFAAEFDPQPFHLDEAAAAQSAFNGLSASGWHTAALCMKLIVTSAFKPAGGMIGLGVDELRWKMAVRPGDTLTIETEVLTVTPSQSKPRGTARVRHALRNQDGAEVFSMIGTILVPMRPKPGEKSP